MKFNPNKHSGGGVVFIDVYTKKPITDEWRREYDSALKFWTKRYRKDPNIAMRPVADVNYFFFSHGVY
jgi:hypothetical protein